MYLVTKEQYDYFKEVVGGQEVYLPGGIGSLKLAGEKVCKERLEEEVKDVRELGNDWESWKRVGGYTPEPKRTTVEALTRPGEVKRGRPRK